MLQHLCVMEGHYNHAFSSPASNRAPAHQPEPKVVRADPQGRRRHSSETFSSSSTPAGEGLDTSPHPSQGDPAAHCESYLVGGQASRWANSASFDCVWMSVEGVRDSPPHRASPRATEVGPPSSATEARSGRMCRNASAGFQNGLNYIALELREEGANAEAAASGATGTNGAAAGEGAASENGAYASIDFTKTDGVSAAKD